jgi:hypothetical protein
VSLGVWVSFIATAVAIFALFYSGRSAHAARDSATAAEEQARAVEDQTRLQRDLARAAAEPMLWVDIRGDDGMGRALVLLLGHERGQLPGDWGAAQDQLRGASGKQRKHGGRCTSS